MTTKLILILLFIFSLPAPSWKACGPERLPHWCSLTAYFYCCLPLASALWRLSADQGPPTCHIQKAHKGDRHVGHRRSTQDDFRVWMILSP